MVAFTIGAAFVVTVFAARHIFFTSLAGLGTNTIGAASFFHILSFVSGSGFALVLAAAMQAVVSFGSCFCSWRIVAYFGNAFLYFSRVG